jgi:succinylglutamic semialdehyde dehydrogenase
VDKLEYKGSFINGSFGHAKKVDETWNLKSPGDFEDELFNVKVAFEDVDKACEAAKCAFAKWSEISMSDRIVFLKKLEALFVEYKNDIAHVISRETGKPTWEALTEATALAGKIKITIESSLDLIKETRIENAIPGVEGVIRFKPKGVLAVLGPFNFPAHLPNGHFIPALLAGNTVVFKPSDKTPWVGQILAEMFKKAEFPPGVFNLIQGQAEVGKRLAKHNLVDGVLFTGSYEVGLKIKKDTIEHYWKNLALEMGGKNASIIWDDADMDKAVYESVLGSYLTAGQRCSCTSRLFLHSNIFDEFIDKFKKVTASLKIGHWSENNFMGPLITEESMQRFIRFQDIAQREGSESLIKGQRLDLKKKGFYVSPSAHLVNKFDTESVYQKSEIFGPDVAIYKIEDLEDTFEKVNSSNYGLVASIFTKNEKNYLKGIQKLDVGLLNWNRTTNGASSKLPFGGTKKSGNGMPSAHFALYYCSTPIASLEDKTPFDKKQILPGMTWE